MKKIIYGMLLPFCMILFCGCTDEDSSRRALMMEGYSEIEVWE